MKTLKQLNAVQTVEDLKDLNIGPLFYNIGQRGGGLGYYQESVAREFGIEGWMLPGKFGAYCNYLGGGIRGAIGGSTFHPAITGQKRQLLEALANACVRAYENAEAEIGLQEPEDEDGEPNWDNLATQGARRAGIRSAY